MSIYSNEMKGEAKSYRIQWQNFLWVTRGQNIITQQILFQYLSYLSDTRSDNCSLFPFPPSATEVDQMIQSVIH